MSLPASDSRNVLKACATGDRRLAARRTTCQSRTIGRPCTSRIARRRVFSSRPMVCSDSKLMPMPACTACLMVSLLAISMLTLSGRRCSANRRSSSPRVPEPGSRIRKVSLARRASGMRRFFASGWPGAAMTTWGWRANGSTTVSMPCGVRPMMAKSTSLSASCFSTSSRLPAQSFRVTPGCFSRNTASRGGTRYCAVLTMAMCSRPCAMPLRAARASSASRNCWAMARLCRCSSAPSSVRKIFLPRRSNNGSPACSSRQLHLHRHGGLGEVQFRRGARETTAGARPPRTPAAGAASRA